MLRMKQAGALAGLVSALALGLGALPAAAADHAQMLSQLIRDAAQGHIAYGTLSPGLADAVRAQAGVAQSELTALGPLRSVTLDSTDPRGVELYRTVFEKGVLEWAFHVDDQGRIDNAIYRTPKPGPDPAPR